MRILFLAKGPFGALGRPTTYTFPKILTDMGHEVQVLCLGTPQVIEENDVVADVAHFSFGIYEISVGNLFERFQITRELIEKFKPHIVHVFTLPHFWVYPLIGKMVRPFGREKWIIDFRSPELRTFKANFLKWRLRSHLMQIGFDAICSPVLVTTYERFHSVRKPLFEVPIGVHLGAIKSKSHNEKRSISKICKFVFIGSIAKLRKLDHLIDGIEEAKNILAGSKTFSVDLYGGGDSVKTLQEKIQKKGLSDNVFLSGTLPQAELFLKLCEYDAGIAYIPYEFYYNSPALKVLEYMAADIFVLGSETNGNKLFIQDQENGVLFPNTREGIGSAIGKAVTDGLPTSYIGAAKQTVAKYDWSVIVKNKLIPMYETVLRK